MTELHFKALEILLSRSLFVGLVKIGFGKGGNLITSFSY